MDGLPIKIKSLEYDLVNGKITAYFIPEEINPFWAPDKIKEVKGENARLKKLFMGLSLGDAIIIQKNENNYYGTD